MNSGVIPHATSSSRSVIAYSLLVACVSIVFLALSVID
nr:MAG TPA: hypothetical protein [Caudoviricetes sp.]